MAQGKIRLDWDGLQLLAGALYLREVYVYRLSVRGEYYRRNNPIKSEYWGDLLSGTPLDFRDAKKKVDYRRWLLCSYPEWQPPKSGRDCRPPEGLLKKAAKLKVTDLHFEWFHLFAEKNLIRYAKPIVPEWTKSFIDKDTPIAQRWGDDLTEALIRLHDREYSRLNKEWAYPPDVISKIAKDGEGPLDIRPDTYGEIEFGISVADICEIPKPKRPGRPSGVSAVTDPEIMKAVQKMPGGNRSANLRAVLSQCDPSTDKNLVVEGSSYVWGADRDSAFKRINNRMSYLQNNPEN
jgi:hypothetical protein